MTKKELSSTMQIAATASTLNESAKISEKKAADHARQTVRKPLAPYLEAVIR